MPTWKIFIPVDTVAVAPATKVINKLSFTGTEVTVEFADENANLVFGQIVGQMQKYMVEVLKNPKAAIPVYDSHAKEIGRQMGDKVVLHNQPPGQEVPIHPDRIPPELLGANPAEAEAARQRIPHATPRPAVQAARPVPGYPAPRLGIPPQTMPGRIQQPAHQPPRQNPNPGVRTTLSQPAIRARGPILPGGSRNTPQAPPRPALNQRSNVSLREQTLRAASEERDRHANEVAERARTEALAHYDAQQEQNVQDANTLLEPTDIVYPVASEPEVVHEGEFIEPVIQAPHQ